MVKAKLSLAILAVFGGLSVNAAVIGNGEYRFGPETAENIACSLAEERAKKDAIEKFVGELIEHSTNEICKDEYCTSYRKYFSETSGEVKNVISKNRYIAPQHKQTVCYVDIVANIEKITNQIQFKVDGKTEYKHGDRFAFNAVINRAGKLAVFNMTGNEYRLIHQYSVKLPNKEFTLPSANQKFEALLPTTKQQSKEVLVFLFTEENLTFHPKYSTLEFDQLVMSLPFLGRKLVNHQINIMR